MKKDITGKIADHAFESSQRILAAVEKLVPTGPNSARFTRAELIAELSKLGTAGVAALGDQLTPNEKQEILRRASIQNQGATSEPSFIPEEETLE